MSKIDQLYVKSVSSAANLNGTTSYRPFGINLGPDEILELRMLRVRYHPHTADLDFSWALLQKNLRREDGVVSPTLPTLRDDDNDILISDRWIYELLLGRQQEMTRVFTFPSPMYIPRSPTWEISSDLNAALGCSAQLWYKIKRVDKTTLMRLMKQYYGRAQTE